jgi:hypothetical protein
MIVGIGPMMAAIWTGGRNDPRLSLSGNDADPYGVTTYPDHALKDPGR